MRILVVTNLYPSPASPSFGTFVASRVGALRRAGVAVEVVAIRSSEAHSRILRKYASLAVRLAWATARAIARRRRPDVVEAHIAYPTGLIAWPVARLTGARLVLFAHGADVRDLPARRRLHRIGARWLLHRADLVIANSWFLAESVRGDFRLPESKLDVISPGIEQHLFASREEGEDARAGILYVGRLVPVKGVALLLEAVAKVRAAEQPAPTLTIVGEGPERPTLERRASELGLDARFVGAVGPEEVAAVMHAARVLAVPSQYEEPLGLVALEGLAAGCLVVASARGGLVESIDDGVTGWLVRRQDPDTWAAALRAALACSAEEVARRRAVGREKAAAHATAVVVPRSIERYKALLA